MMSELDLVQKFGIKEGNFFKFLKKVTHLYNKNDNPFHNFDHGMTVMQSCYFFMRHTMAGSCFAPLGKLSILFAGLMHDIDHTGTTNGYQISSMSHLAILYNDKSVLENHHCATAFDVLLN